MQSVDQQGSGHILLYAAARGPVLSVFVDFSTSPVAREVKQLKRASTWTSTSVKTVGVAVQAEVLIKSSDVHVSSLLGSVFVESNRKAGELQAQIVQHGHATSSGA